MKRLKKILIFFLVLILILLVIFILFGAVIVITPEVGNALKTPGTTFFLVRRPELFSPIYINLDKEMQTIVLGSLLNFITGKSIELPWFADKKYIASHAFFCYNTEHGVILDKSFFDAVK